MLHGPQLVLHTTVPGQVSDYTSHTSTETAAPTHGEDTPSSPERGPGAGTTRDAAVIGYKSSPNWRKA